MKAQRGMRGEELPVSRKRLHKGPRWRECDAFGELKIGQEDCSKKVEMKPKSLDRPFLGEEVTTCSLGTMVKTSQS